jgi:protein-tyrosine-phosphatase
MYLGRTPTHWSIPDPSLADGVADARDAFRTVAAEIEERIELLIAELSTATREQVRQ